MTMATGRTNTRDKEVELEASQSNRWGLLASQNTAKLLYSTDQEGDLVALHF